MLLYLIVIAMLVKTFPSAAGQYWNPTEIYEPDTSTVVVDIFSVLALKCRNWDGNMIHWKFNSTLINASQHNFDLFMVNTFIRGHLVKLLTLNIDKVEPSHSGVYTCATVANTNNVQVTVSVVVRTLCDSSPCPLPCRCEVNVSVLVTYSCICKHRGDAESIEANTEPCASFPCVGSICLDTVRPHGYMCVCPTNSVFQHGLCVPKNITVKLPEPRHPQRIRRQNVCSSSPCTRAGTCLLNDRQAGYTCKCPTNFAAFNSTCVKDVFILKPCIVQENNCRHGGTCIATHSLITNTHTVNCKCPNGRKGEFCEDFFSNILPCDVNVCLNNGTCLKNVATDEISCICLHGFTGKWCDCKVTIEECQASVCNYNGQCFLDPLSGSEVCICRGNYTGTFCQFGTQGDLNLFEEEDPHHHGFLETASNIVLAILIIISVIVFVACGAFIGMVMSANS